jgi:phospholipase/carboxylesterase
MESSSVALTFALAFAPLSIGCIGVGAERSGASVGTSYDVAPQAVDNGPPVAMNDGSYTVAGVRYLEIITGGASPNETLPMVVALHGHGGSPVEFSKHFYGFPARARFIVPFAVTPLGNGGFEWFPRVRRMAPEELASRLPVVVDRVATAISMLERTRPTSGRAIVVGFSQGAVMAYGLAVRHPELVATACPFAGQIPDQAIPPPNQYRAEIHGFHGSNDDTVRYAEGQRTVATLQRMGYTADLTTLDGVGHQFGPASPLVAACVQRSIMSGPH